MNKHHSALLKLSVALFLVSQCFLIGCAHKKTVEQITQDQLQSKRVALVEIKGADEATAHVEVAVLNQIRDKGRFEIVDKPSVQDALVIYPDESDWQRLGKKVGADYLLSIKVVEFNVLERAGLDRVKEEDPVLEQESGEKKKVIASRYVKVKSYQGDVRLSCIFYDVKENAIVYQGLGVASDTLNSRDGALPGKLHFLEQVTAKAMDNFFERIPK
jgi:hypothetical protein